MNKKRFAGTAILVGSLVSAEVSGKIDKADVRSNAADAPHNHVEIPEQFVINVSSPLSASGQISVDTGAPISQPQRPRPWLHPAANLYFFGPDR
jgi:hypothetical protein